MNTPRHPRLAVLSLASAAVLGCAAAWLAGAFGDLPIEHPAACEPMAATTSLQAAAPQARSEVSLVHGYYGAPVGATFRYELTGRFEYGVRHPEGGQQTSGMQLRAALHLGVAGRRDDAILVRAELRELALSALAGNTGADDGGLAAAAGQPFHARLGLDGRVQAYQFAPGLDGEQRNFVRGLFAAFMHTVPHDAAAGWEAEDDDAAGVYVARFELEAASATTRVQRHKLRYTAMAGNELHPHEIRGGSRAAFDAAIGWLCGVDVDERTTLTMTELGLVIELHSVLHAALAGHGNEAMAHATAPWDASFPAAGHLEDFRDSQEASERSRWRKQLEGITLDTLIAELQTLLAMEPRDAQAIDRAFQAVVWLVKLDPARAAELQVRVAGMPAELADVLVSALGAAGTDAAQDVLAAMRHDPNTTPALRTSATIALFQVDKASPRILGDLASDLGSAGDFTGDHAMAMLLLGALAPRAGEARIGGKTALETLLDFETRSAEQGRADLWLNALSNVGRPECLPHVQRYLGHDDERVRGAAYHALRLVDTAPATALLERGLEDPAPAVRSDVVNALGQHRSAAACDALMRASRADADPAVRRAALEGLCTFARSRPAARAAIERMAGSDPDTDNRRAALTVLEGLR